VQRFASNDRAVVAGEQDGMDIPGFSLVAGHRFGLHHSHY
jgi:hypothetical protein